MRPELAPIPVLSPIRGPFGYALSVDVEEWYHTCLVPAYVRPELRPAGLAEELDFLLPELLGLLAEAKRQATFFVLGEVAARHGRRIRELAAAGHEIGSHSFHHLRANDLPVRDFVAQARDSKALLEDLTGRTVRGFRAPEWSFREPGNPRLAELAALGFEYDSSLAPYLGAGSLGNPRWPTRLIWHERGAGPEATLIELPPLSLGGPLRLPAGSWTGRPLPVSWVVAAARSSERRGGLPLAVVHPWEVSGRPTPGRLPGFARFVHETGRLGYRERFRSLLAALPWQSVAATLAPALCEASRPLPGEPFAGPATSAEASPG